MDGLGSAGILLFEGFRFDRGGGGLFRLDRDGVAELIPLGSRALDLLALLAARQGQLVSKDEIMKAVWSGMAVEEANLTVQVATLRRTLDRDREQGSCIQTVIGRGYRFVAPVTPIEALTAASIAKLGGVSGAPIANDRPPEPLSVVAPIDSASPAPTLRRPYRRRRAVMATVAGALCLAAAIFAVVHWRSPSPWQDNSAPRLSIVVLPFTNLSNDPGQQYFADALTEDLTVDMSRVAHMFVISSSTAFRYKGNPIDTKQIGRELGVRYVLEGSVERSADRVRVDVQLIDAGTDAHLWVDRFDRDRGELFALQDEITGRIARHLNAELASAADAGDPPDPPGTLDYILRGRDASRKWPILDNYAEAIGWFERALALSPQSVEARNWLAGVLVMRVLRQRAAAPAADLARAEELVEQALAASPHSTHAHFVRAQVLRVQHRCVEAIPEYETVVAADPSFVAARANLAWCKFMIGEAQDQVIPLQEQAIRYGPGEPFIADYYYRIGVVRLLQSNIDDAIGALEIARNGYPAQRADVHGCLAAAYALKGETERAATELAEARRLSHDDRYSTVARLKATQHVGSPKVRAMFEQTYFAGLRKAGMAEN
jgi:TolB-like protein/DNA-binding winged helix-turn-helix (wHTH) protein